MTPIDIVFDTNYLFHSEFSLFSGYGKRPLRDDEDDAAFATAVAGRLFHVMDQLPHVGHVVCCFDSRSWRRAFYDGYKSSRENADGSKGIMDKETKDRFYRIMDDFMNLLGDVGIIISRVPGAEGDDLLYRWANRFNAEGRSVVLVTGDGDLGQVVRGDDDPWTIAWSGHQTNGKVLTSTGWRSAWLDKRKDLSLFDMSGMSDRREDFRKILRAGATLETVDPRSLILRKILVGDDGDDVPSSWNGLSPTGRPARLTPKKAEKVVELFLEAHPGIDPLDDWWSRDANIDWLAGAILRVMKSVDGDAERAPVVEALRRNARLVWLDDRCLPETLVNGIEKHMTKSLEHARQSMQRERWNRRAVLEGSRLDSGGATPRAFRPILGQMPQPDSNSWLTS